VSDTGNGGRGAASRIAPRIALGDLLVAAALVALGLFLAVETAVIPVSPAYARIGPTVFPVLVAAGLVFLGFILVWQALKSGEEAAARREPAPDLAALAWISAGLLIHAATLDHIGFVPASTLLFALVARGFGDRRWVVTLPIGLALALVVYVGFTRGLALALPTGSLFAGG
jgi:putative tricarboxylic transport membrane protein